jgi:CRP-like cAMP-binding protein
MTLLEYAGGAEGGVAGTETFELPRTQEQLAAELATTRESVARALGRLRREGLIAQRGTRVRLLNHARLELVASSG